MFIKHSIVLSKGFGALIFALGLALSQSAAKALKCLPRQAHSFLCAFYGWQWNGHCGKDCCGCDEQEHGSTRVD
jgi:hypothetical protein